MSRCTQTPKERLLEISLHTVSGLGVGRRVEAVIRGLGPTLSCLPGTWLVACSMDCVEVWEFLTPLLGDHDKLLVTEIGDNWAVYGFGEEQINWLNRY